MFKLLKLIMIVVVGGAVWVAARKAPTAESTAVVVSIKPIHSLVCGLLKGIETPALLLKTDASPHTYAPTPRDVEALQKAQLFIWVGPAYEAHLYKAVQEGTTPPKRLTLLDVKELTLYTPRQGDSWGFESHTHGEGHNHKHHHHDHGTDGHVWLDVTNAIVIAKTCHKALVTLWPQHTQKLDANLREVLDELASLHRVMTQILGPARGKPYLVYHDGTQYIDRRYGTKCVGSLTREPGIPTTPKHTRAMVALLNQKVNKPICILTEPQYNAPVVAQLAQTHHIKTATLDYIGTGLTLGPEAYGEMMRTLAQTLATALAE
jgi:zinc transport system substrate-binding protein